MIGGIGFTNCFRLWQLALMMASTSSTWLSSTPSRMVALPCFRKPPDELKRVARYSFSSRASTRVAASSLWTMAVTSFTAGRLLQQHAQARRATAERQYGAGERPRATRHAPRGARARGVLSSGFSRGARGAPARDVGGSGAAEGGLDVRLIEVPQDDAGNGEADHQVDDIGAVVHELQHCLDDAQHLDADAERPCPRLERPESIGQHEAQDRVGQDDDPGQEGEAAEPVAGGAHGGTCPEQCQ